ncbi:hypothetical protein F4821DRAFT_243697 [Hypoxylon rubiginosum]|uniref:Uncharacterized protein n=1 Tax=Hypoxylon rubiginosum TaxID=110542 RepID=A0ACC0CUH2_9PEZI|nr:hypothetical protein F4821DRAFT_243697 [Hypoxylon rubiginosum]
METELGLVNIGCKIFDMLLGAKHAKEGSRTKSTKCFVLTTMGMAQVAKSTC